MSELEGFSDNTDEDPDYCSESGSDDDSNGSQINNGSTIDEGNRSINESSDEVSIEMENNDSHLTNENPNQTTKRVRENNFCFYCESSVGNFARHLQRMHPLELDVQEFMSKPANSRERKNLISNIRKRGNYLHNSYEERIKAVKKGAFPESRNTHLPCEFCLGFYNRTQLWRHKKICSKNKNNKNSGQALSQNLLCKNLKIDEQLKSQVFPRMRADEVSLVAKRDNIICSFGARYLKTHREKHFVNVTSRKMRELAKLLMEVKKKEPAIKTMFDVLKPQYYDLLVEAAKSVSKYNENDESFNAPTYAINISKSLKDCCTIAITCVLKRKFCFGSITSAEAEADLKTLIHLITSNWQFDISTQAANDLNSKKWNKVTIIPLASDLKIFKNFLIKESDSAANAVLADKMSIPKYSKLLELIFCRVLLLNRRRPGELQRVLLDTYRTADMQTNYEEFQDAITPSEKILMSKFKRIVIRGKRGRGVPVLFSTDVQTHISILLEVRDNIFGDISNAYLFGRPKCKTPIAGYKVLDKYVKLSGVKNAKALTATRLRKHLATITQIFNMNEGDIEQLATFMGHTDRVHRGEYRLPDDVYQTAKICKLLLMMEEGSAAKYKGKNLNEIDLNMEDDLLALSRVDDDSEEEFMEDPQRVLPQEMITAQHEYIEQDETTKPSSIAEISNNSKTGKKRTLVPWSEEQKSVTKEFFKKHIAKKQAAKRHECEELIDTHPQLFHNKSWLKMKVYVQNLYSKK